MASITEIEQKVNALAVRMADEIDKVRLDFGIAPGGLPGTDWINITGKPSTFPGDWASLSNRPTVFPSDWASLAGIPPAFPPTAHIHTANQISDFTTAVNTLITAAGGFPPPVGPPPASISIGALLSIFEDF